ncbi:6626_t:CDS:2, partial [Cetraspora pellucida]
MRLLKKKQPEYDLCIITSEDNIIEADNKEKTETVLMEICTLSDTKSEEWIQKEFKMYGLVEDD